MLQKIPGKIREVNNILNNSGFEIVSLLELSNVPEIIEDGFTFDENARKKAEMIFEAARIPSIAGMIPVWLSNNWMEGLVYFLQDSMQAKMPQMKENNEKLIRVLEQFSEPHHAMFICSAVYFDGK